MISTLGRIWPKRSNTPCTPKSGLDDEKVAPRPAAASMAITVSSRLGIQAATRSPTPTPFATRKAWKRATWTRRSSKLSTRAGAPDSSTDTIAGRSLRVRSRFSAKFSVAPRNQVAPGMTGCSRTATGAA